MRRIKGGRIWTIAEALLTGAVLAGCIGGPASTPAPPSPVPTAAVRWSALAAADPMYDGAFEAPFAGVNAGVAYGNGFVLVGVSKDDRDAWQGAIWTSSDGAGWTRVADSQGTFASMYIANVASDGHRLVALGWASPWFDARRGPYVAWVSDDGVTWQRHDVEGTALGHIYAEGLVGSRAGFLAWGSREDRHTELLRSVDGIDWQPVAYPGAESANIVSVAASGDGFLAVGAGYQPTVIAHGPTAPARAWSSTDGTNWVSAHVDDGWAFRAVYPAAAGVYAVGAHECSACVGPDLEWHSVDGRSWSTLGEQASLVPFVASNGSQVASFDWQGDRSVALSDDGLAWHKVAAHLPAAEFDAGIVIGAGGVLLLFAKTPSVNGVQVLHAGVMFLRGS